jgi:ribonuclease HI
MNDKQMGTFVLRPWTKPDPQEVYQLEFDGSCVPDPGEMQIGFVIRDPAGQIVAEFSSKLGHGTKTIAEYQALIHGLQAALDLGITNLHVQSDSMIVVTAANCRTTDARATPKNPAAVTRSL